MEDILRITEVLGGGRILGRKIDSPAALDALVRKGLPYGAVESVLNQVAVSAGELVELLASSKRTIARRRAEKRLSAAESDRLARLARIFARAEEVFEDKEKARRWLHKPNRVLGGRTPLQALETDIGTLEVVRILGRIEYGVYS
jgi:putative toxin-antitoxin system antitoxin component (TIGR02293 family)